MIPTARLLLEPLREAHAVEMAVVLADPQIYDHIDDGPPDPAALAARYRQLESRQSPDGAQRWLNWVIRTASGRCAGYVQATIYPDQTADIAFVLNSEHWGQGYGPEATEAMLCHLAEHYAVRLAYATTDERNARSQRLLLSLGFHEISSLAYRHGGVSEGDVVFRRELPVS
jgi:[ribosomal protein S5]-alanine N-acetyltransferase